MSTANIIADVPVCHSRLCSGISRSLMGGNPVVRLIPTTSLVQSAEAGRDFVLQHGQDTAGMVEYMADSRRAFQPGLSSFAASTNNYRSAVTTTRMSASSLWTLCGNWP